MLFADGAFEDSSSSEGAVAVGCYSDGTEPEWNSDVRAEAEVIGWRSWYYCGSSGKLTSVPSRHRQTSLRQDANSRPQISAVPHR